MEYVTNGFYTQELNVIFILVLIAVLGTVSLYGALISLVNLERDNSKRLQSIEKMLEQQDKPTERAKP